jgi:hypothetical protein
MDISPEDLEQRITDHLVHKGRFKSERSRAAWLDREENRMEREAARDAHAD